jgi:plasmid stabilization system protein ParE
VRRAATLAALGVLGAAAYAYLLRPALSHPRHAYDHALADLQRDQGLDLDPRRTYAESTMRWLGWYLGPVALGAGVAGLAVALRHAAVTRRRSWLPFLGIVLSITALYVARPSIFPNQVWAMRRFLPVTIPGLLLLAASATQALHDRLTSGPPRFLRVGLTASLAIGVVAVPAYQLTGLADAREQAGGLAAMSRLCASLPARAVVWTIPGPDETRLLQPVHAFCRVPVAQSPPQVSRRLVESWAASVKRLGHNPAMLSTRRGPLVRLLDERAPDRPEVVFRYHHLEETITHRPTVQERERLPLWVGEP